MWRALALQLALLTLLAAVLHLPGAVGQSTCRIRVVGTGTQPTTAQATASAIRSASVQCTGAAVQFTGPVALRGVGTFTGKPSSSRLWMLGRSAKLRRGSKPGACLATGFNDYLWHAGATFTEAATASGLLTFTGAQVGAESQLNVRGSLRSCASP